VHHEAELEDLFREGTDYGELLKPGEIHRVVDDPYQWRAEIRRQARRDKIRVRTFGREGSSLVIAVREREYALEEMAAIMNVHIVQERANARAIEMSHELEGWVSHDGRAGTHCRWCGARLYVEWQPHPNEPIIEGEAVEERCRLA
jgi:hypothetical protein